MTAPVQVGPSPQGGGPAVSIRDIHLNILILAAHGNTDQEIADQTGSTRYAVMNHWKVIRPQLGARDRAHAVAIAVSSGIVKLTDPVAPLGFRVASGKGRTEELLALAEAGLLDQADAAELRAVVGALQASRRSAGGLQSALSQAREERDEAFRVSVGVERGLRDVVARLPQQAEPLKRVLSGAAESLRVSRGS